MPAGDGLKTSMRALLLPLMLLVHVLLLLVDALGASRASSTNARARWTIAANGKSGSLQHNQLLTNSGAYEQRWGQQQQRRVEADSTTIAALTNIGKVRNGTDAADQRVPFLIVAPRDASSARPAKGRRPALLPAEAEEEEMPPEPMAKMGGADATVIGNDVENTFSAITTPTSLVPYTVPTVSSPSSSSKMALFSLPTLFPTSPPATSSSPSPQAMMLPGNLSPPLGDQPSPQAMMLPGNLSPLLGDQSPPPTSFDLRQLPGLMLLVKQLPELFSSFSATGGSVAKQQQQQQEQQATNALLPPPFAGDGMQLPQLGPAPPVAYGNPLFALQSSSSNNNNEGEYGSGDNTEYGSGDNKLLLLGNKAYGGAAEGDKLQHHRLEGGTKGPLMLANLPLPRAQIRPIVPMIATHGLAKQEQDDQLMNQTEHGGREEKNMVITEEADTVARKEEVVDTSSGRKMAANAFSPQKLRRKQQRLNIYGVTPAPSSAYSAPMAKSEEEEGLAKTSSTPSSSLEDISSPSATRRPRPQLLDIERLTVDELGQLEQIHRKLFAAGEKGKAEEAVEEGWRGEPRSELSSASPNAIEQQQRTTTLLPATSTAAQSAPGNAHSAPRQQFSAVGDGNSKKQKLLGGRAQLDSLVAKGVELGQLDQSMLNELLAVGELPDLEGLTRGMDLTLLQKPGGFAALKQQFVQRMLQRALHGGADQH